MAETVVGPPEIDPNEVAPLRRIDSEVHLTGDLSAKEEGVFASLLSNLRDVFFPVKLPPLALESKPIAVVDRMAVKRDPKATAIATVVNGAILLLAIWWGTQKVVTALKPKVDVVSLDAPPPPAPIKAQVMGGGGGQKGPPLTKGNPPKFSPDQIVPPIAPPLNKPKLAVDPTINVQQDLKMAKSDIPQFGMPNAPTVGLSGGGGGNGSGLGSGNGNGLGPGSGGNTGGGVYRVGGGVSAPQILFQPDPEFSEEARKAKVSGIVVVYLQVDPTGKPIHVKVLRGIGMGLDEKAVDAVSRYKFRPATKDGKPVTVELNVEVNFQIF